LRLRSPARFILEIDIGERLSAVVAHYETGGLFFDRPPRREAARLIIKSSSYPERNEGRSRLWGLGRINFPAGKEGERVRGGSAVVSAAVPRGISRDAAATIRISTNRPPNITSFNMASLHHREVSSATGRGELL